MVGGGRDMTFRLTETEIKKAVHDGIGVPIGAAYELLCQRQVEKVARLLATGATVDELKKEAKI